MENHKSGRKVLDAQRLKSLKTRMNSYQAQMLEASRTLSPEELESLIISEKKKLDEL